jgi:ribosome-associated protein
MPGPDRRPKPAAGPARNAHPLAGKPAKAAVPAPAPSPTEPPKPDDAITLGQFLKVAELAESGGQAKALVRAGGILVNGAEETRPGRRLVPGDVVTVNGEAYEITADG